MKIILLFVFISLSQFTSQANLRSKATRIYVGSAIAPEHFSDTQYKTIAAQQFNCLTPENQMKWDAVEGTRGHKNFGPADELVKFAQTNGMKVRGHTLVWHSQVPGWVNGLAKAELETVMKSHITEEMTHFKGKIYAWDVVNEVFEENGQLRNSLWSKNFGEGFIAEAFKTARSADPLAKLYINDYNVEGMNAKSNGLYNLVKKLKGEGVPIDGVGFQAHFMTSGVPGNMQTNLQRFADLGVDVAITELDIRMQEPSTQAKLEQQAKDYAHVFSACEAVERCVGVTVWGFTDKYSWVPSVFGGQGDACLWDKQYTAKPAVSAVENALK